MKHLALTLFLASLNAFAGPGHGAGRAHPSAFYCAQSGGKSLTLFSESGGSDFHCQLGDSIFSPMSLYFYKKVGVKNAYHLFMNPPAVNADARVSPTNYCRALGGQVEVLKNIDGKKVYNCMFTQKDTGQLSGIGLVTLYRGKLNPRNKALVDFINSIQK